MARFPCVVAAVALLILRSLLDTTFHVVAFHLPSNSRGTFPHTPFLLRSKPRVPRQSIAKRTLSATESATSSVAAVAADDDIIVLKGRNIELTDALQQQVKKRIGNIIAKLGGTTNVSTCDVILSVAKNPKVRFDYVSALNTGFERLLN
jgi:hypothetical protein